MNTIIINGKRIVTDDNGPISIINGKVTVGGRSVDMSEFSSAKEINIVIEGSVDSVSTDSGSVTVKGDAGSVTVTNGDVRVDGAVKGSVNTVSGDVRAGGSIGGSVNTVSGDISSKR